MSRNPTQMDIARAAGVSRSLVSLALSDAPSVKKATRERIQQIAEDLGYVRNAGAASLKKQSSVVGVVLPFPYNPFLEDVTVAIQNEAESLGFLAVTATSSNDGDREALIIHRFRELQVAGIVVVSPVQAEGALREVARRVPTVQVAAMPIGGRADTIYMDEIRAAELVIDHLRDRGWKRIVHMSADMAEGAVWAERRFKALQRVAGDKGMAVYRVPQGTPASEYIAAHAAEWRADRAAVVAHNDLMAIDVVAALRGAGCTPGDDVAVVGYDDTYLAKRAEFGITSVRQDVEEFARLALAAISERTVDPSMDARVWQVDPTLSVRTTT